MEPGEGPGQTGEYRSIVQEKASKRSPRRESGDYSMDSKLERNIHVYNQSLFSLLRGHLKEQLHHLEVRSQASQLMLHAVRKKKPADLPGVILKNK